MLGFVVMWIWLHGLLSWALAGVLIGLLAWRLFPGRPRLQAGLSLLVGVVSACVGGTLATYLGFGGLAAFDARSLTVAALTAMVCLLAYRLLSLAR